MFTFLDFEEHFTSLYVVKKIDTAEFRFIFVLLIPKFFFISNVSKQQSTFIIILYITILISTGIVLENYDKKMRFATCYFPKTFNILM